MTCFTPSKRASKTFFYGILVSEITDFSSANTRCDPPKSHALFNPIDEHTVKKLGFELKNGKWVRKGVIDLRVHDDEAVEGDEDNEVESNAYSTSLSTS
ncbi:Uncharacterized protein TCM_024678 [Theobroma cacao]|uniref:Uncharacterized protein n=1 Tax=Theobroma cacao TaxID=3641 RepID=A0A061EWU0_THECC|nr:Uncharacterized protein TCM_024678 [Theobroma cacao]